MYSNKIYTAMEIAQKEVTANLLMQRAGEQIGAHIPETFSPLHHSSPHLCHPTVCRWRLVRKQSPVFGPLSQILYLSYGYKSILQPHCAELCSHDAHSRHIGPGSHATVCACQIDRVIDHKGYHDSGSMISGTG